MISAITRHVAFFVYPGFVLLDLERTARSLLGRRGHGTGHLPS